MKVQVNGDALTMVETFTESEVKSLRPSLWLDANDINGDGTSFAGTLVDIWKDKSGFENDATASGSARPTYIDRFKGIEFTSSSKLDLSSSVNLQTIVAVIDPFKTNSSKTVTGYCTLDAQENLSGIHVKGKNIISKVNGPTDMTRVKTALEVESNTSSFSTGNVNYIGNLTELGFIYEVLLFDYNLSISEIRECW